METDQFEIEPPPTMRQKRTWHQTQAMIAVTWGYLVYGASIGFNAPVIHSLMQGNATNVYGGSMKLSFQQASWMSGILSLGAFLGYLSFVSLMGSLGRKILIWCTTLCYLIGHLTIFLASNTTHLYFARFVTGFGVGGTIAVCGQYAYEMTTRDMRGLLCCSIQLPVAFGILFSYVIGKYVSWNELALVNMCLLIPYWILIKTTPESPYFLVGRGKEYSASKSIEWLHGRDVNVTDHELFQIKQENKMKEMQKNSPTAVLMSHHWKPFSICLMLAALLQLSGYNVFIYYSVIIFDTIAPDIMHPYDPSILSVCVMLLSYIFVLTVSYRLKRRHLLLISMVGMTGLHFILGTCWSYNGADLRPYLHPAIGNESISTSNVTQSPSSIIASTSSFMELHKNVTLASNQSFAFSTATPISTFSGDEITLSTSTDSSYLNELENSVHHGIKFQALSIATVAAFLFISNIGWVALNQVICAELLPKEIHRSANILIVGFSFLSAFISIKMFADLVQSLDAGHTFYLFGGICGFAALFTLLFVPETSQL